MEIIMIKIKKFMTLILLLSLLTITACEVNKDSSLTQKSIIYCIEGSPESFNPQTVSTSSKMSLDATVNQLYDRLITIKENEYTFQPSIAKSWHITSDGKIVTFYLRKNVSFHQTDYFTPTRFMNADDVIFSFNRILNTEHEFYYTSGGKYPFFEKNKFSELVSQVEKINDYTIRFSLKENNSSFLSYIASPHSVVLSKEYAIKLTKNDQHQKIDTFPIGTGPFKYKEYRSGSLIRYYKHEKYWGKKVTSEQLVYDITSSNTARLTKLLTNECDAISHPIAHQKIQENDNLNLTVIDDINLTFLAFNTMVAPLNDLQVRKAISYAINKEAIINTIYFGLAQSADHILPVSSWAYDKSITSSEYSTSKAIEILTKAGYENGFTLELSVKSDSTIYNPDAFTMAELIKKDLKKVGIQVNITLQSPEQFNYLVSLGQHQTVISSWAASHSDPDDFFTPTLSCASSALGNNPTFWCNPVFDSILTKSLKNHDIKKRKTYYKQAMKILTQQVPLLPIAHSKRFQAHSKNLVGNMINKTDMTLTFKDVVKH
jgi:cationic peptide transport system substrate-binding protein